MSPRQDPRDKTPSELLKTLTDLGIIGEWSVSRELANSLTDPTAAPALGRVGRRTNPSAPFQNLFVGTIAERVFEKRYLNSLEAAGFTVTDLHERGDNRDYVVEQGELVLPINVKTASTLFRKAKIVVGLEPEDCIPISAYKAIGASERVPDLVYVDLVDFELREKVDAFISTLTGDSEVVWELLSWYGGSGIKKAQDRFIAWLFELHGSRLDALVPSASSFRVISAQRVLSIMREMPRRCPGLGVKAAGMGAFISEVNIHVSVQKETVAWDEIEAIIRRDGIGPVLERIRRRRRQNVPAPTI